MEEIITEYVNLVDGNIHVKFNVNPSDLIITQEEVRRRKQMFTTAAARENAPARALDAASRWTAIEATMDQLLQG